MGSCPFPHPGVRRSSTKGRSACQSQSIRARGGFILQQDKGISRAPVVQRLRWTEIGCIRPDAVPVRRSQGKNRINVVCVRTLCSIQMPTRVFCLCC
jgi:hypothetical protein